jgi:hypothetical protein
MELQPVQDAAGLLWREGLVERACRVGVEVVLHQADTLGVGIALLDEIAQALGVVLLGAVLRYRHMALARQRLDHDKEVGGAVPLVLVVPALDVAGSEREARTHIRV